MTIRAISGLVIPLILLSRLGAIRISSLLSISLARTEQSSASDGRLQAVRGLTLLSLYFPQAPENRGADTLHLIELSDRKIFIL